MTETRNVPGGLIEEKHGPVVMDEVTRSSPRPGEDRLISHTLTSLDEINHTFAAMRQGEVLRSVLRFPAA